MQGQKLEVRKRINPDIVKPGQVIIQGKARDKATGEEYIVENLFNKENKRLLEFRQKYPNESGWQVITEKVWDGADGSMIIRDINKFLEDSINELSETESYSAEYQAGFKTAQMMLKAYLGSMTGRQGHVEFLCKIINPEKTVIATGFARESYGDGYVNRKNGLENCESSAIGRALQSCGYIGEALEHEVKYLKGKESIELETLMKKLGMKESAEEVIEKYGDLSVAISTLSSLHRSKVDAMYQEATKRGLGMIQLGKFLASHGVVTKSLYDLTVEQIEDATELLSSLATAKEKREANDMIDQVLARWDDAKHGAKPGTKPEPIDLVTPISEKDIVAIRDSLTKFLKSNPEPIKSTVKKRKSPAPQKEKEPEEKAPAPKVKPDEEKSASPKESSKKNTAPPTPAQNVQTQVQDIPKAAICRAAAAAGVMPADIERVARDGGIDINLKNPSLDAAKQLVTLLNAEATREFWNKVKHNMEIEAKDEQAFRYRGRMEIPPFNAKGGADTYYLPDALLPPSLHGWLITGNDLINDKHLFWITRDGRMLPGMAWVKRCLEGQDIDTDIQQFMMFLYNKSISKKEVSEKKNE